MLKLQFEALIMSLQNIEKQFCMYRAPLRPPFITAQPPINIKTSDENGMFCFVTYRSVNPFLSCFIYLFFLLFCMSFSAGMKYYEMVYTQQFEAFGGVDRMTHIKLLSVHTILQQHEFRVTTSLYF
jgi:hypothetical protein